MIRDMELVRALLLQIEAVHEKASWKDLTPKDDEAEAGRVLAHLKLIEEAGLTKSIVVNVQGNRLPQAIELTWDGHEFLDSVRDTEVWRRTKSGAAKMGTAGLQLMLEMGKAYAKQVAQERLGLQLG
jgi:hypothetical protein